MSPFLERGKTALAFVAFVLSIALPSVAAHGEVPDPAVTDLIGNGPILDIRVDGPFQNPLVGFRGEIELRRIAGMFNVGAEAGYGVNILADDYPVVPLFGCEGLSARASLGVKFAETLSWNSAFYAVTEVDRTRDTVTYAGFRYQRPDYESHWIELAARLEPTGITRVVAYDETTLTPVYGLKPGYTFFLFPRYRFIGESRSSLEGFNPDSGYFVSFAAGPWLTPDLKKLGGAIEGTAAFSIVGGLQIHTSVMLGLASVLNVPEGIMIVNPDNPKEYRLMKDYEGGMFGYLPIRLSVGLSYSFSFGKGETR